MNKRIYRVTFIIISIIILTLSFGCKKKNKQDDGTVQYTIYQKALSSGYEGSYEDWLTTIKGIDGTSIVKIEVNDKGELLVTLSNGKVSNLGSIKGQTGPVGPVGPVGPAGKDGISIINASINSQNELILTYSNNETVNLGNIVGEAGKELELQVTTTNIEWRYTGESLWKKLLSLNELKGEAGKSAYEIYLEYHPDYHKSEQAWLEDLVNGALTKPEVVYYNVTFMNEEEELYTKKIASGSFISAPSDLQKENYQLLGWYCNNDAWRFELDVVTKDLTLVTKWEQITEPKEVVVPRYQGMSIESLGYQPTPKERRYFKTTNNTIKDVIVDLLDIKTTERVEYYANKGDKFNIVIHLYNPSSFEILSFTLNNYKYQSYEFKEGSNSTELIIEVDAGQVSGIKEYTIDAIKYIDKTEIKDVQMDGEKNVKAGIKYDITPSSSILQEEILTTSYKTTIEIKDDNQLIDINNGLYFFMYEENNIVSQNKLTLGVNYLNVENLYMGSNYGYMVIGVYDDCSGKGKTAVTLSEGMITTLDGYLVKALTSDFDSILIELDQSDNLSVIKKVSLYEGDNYIKDTIVENNNILFEGLYSNTEYKVRIVYTYYDHNDVLIEKELVKTISTQIKQLPSIAFNEVKETKYSISYSLIESDIDKVRKQVEIFLYHGEVLITSKSTLIDTFDNLFSNNTYRLVIKYTYDLADNLGVQVIEKEIEVTTKP